jgi:hypothetical protein
MKNATRHIGKLEILRREPSSRNGNPRYFLQVAGVTCYTAPDSSLGYSITNHDGKTVSAVIETYRGRPTIREVAPVI